MINNFISNGVNPNFIDILCSIQDDLIPLQWKRLSEKYNYVRFFFYKDTRFKRDYVSSIRPNLLKQHFKKYPELNNDTIFYCDCDVVFTKPISEWITEEMINDDNWYGSDCRWYISHSYIHSKGVDILTAMCKIVDINEFVVKNNELNCIGAQYIIKNVDDKFWEKVEKDSENLFSNISSLNKIKKEKEPKYHEIQIWCADMWALLWNGWKIGNKTICHNNLEFSWANSPIELWDKNNIFHNAGVTSNLEGMFYKADYINQLPYKTELVIDREMCSYKYYVLMKEVGKNSILLSDNFK